MDLILFQPGNPDFSPKTSYDHQTGGSWMDQSFSNGDATLPSGKWIELVSLHQGMKQQNNGHPVITEFTCVKYVDAVSVKMYELCLRAETLGKGAEEPSRIYIARNSGDKRANIMTIELRDATITEIQFQSHPDDMPTEQFKINFAEIIWTYNTQNTDTTIKGSIKTGWSFIKNQLITEFTK
jgi:type VI secretion system secreted protein Hcp